MSKQFGLLVLVVFSVFMSTNILATPAMSEGKWEITAKMEMPGMPMQMPAHTFTHCVTAEDMAPHDERPGQECKTIKSNVNGNTVTWQMECKSPQGTTMMDGRATYTGDTMNGEIKMQQDGMDMTQRMNGRRLGQCN